MLMLEQSRRRTAEVLGTHGSVVAVVRVPDEGRGDTSGVSPHEVELVAREVDLDTCALYRGTTRLGWIRRDGHYYLALVGEPGHPHECGHALLWDEAAAMLLTAA
ncbi:MAG: hypothetical protein FWD85_08085 [Microbacteriaceae bacterium]|nr:hypothetical protein [Microbacteriaceae bacterium]